MKSYAVLGLLALLALSVLANYTEVSDQSGASPNTTQEMVVNNNTLSHNNTTNCAFSAFAHEYGTTAVGCGFAMLVFAVLVFACRLCPEIMDEYAYLAHPADYL